MNVDISALTQREQQVLAMIGRGYSIPKIADQLFRSQKTIETHRQSLGRKLGASNRVELARIAIQVGLAPLDVGGPGPTAGPNNPRSRLAADALAAEAVHQIDAACAEVVDVAYARALCLGLNQTMGVTGAGMFGLEDDGDTMRSVALSYRGGIVEPATMTVTGSACEKTLKEGFFRCEGQLGEACPGFDSAGFFDMKSYMGLRLDDPATNEPLGTLVLFCDENKPFSVAAETVLRVCSVRAAAELGQMRLIDSLQRSVESLEQRLAELEEGEMPEPSGA